MKNARRASGTARRQAGHSAGQAAFNDAAAKMGATGDFGFLAENDFHVVALDLIGFGYSSKPSWFDYSIVSQARVVERFMNRIGVGAAIVVESPVITCLV